MKAGAFWESFCGQHRIYCGDAVEVLRHLPDGSVHCCITSPPYYGLRDYGVDGQIGLEDTPEHYRDRLVCVFREVKRVLRNDGVLFLNLGDSYWAKRSKNGVEGGVGHNARASNSYQLRAGGVHHHVYKPKDAMGMPWRVAFALQADGWYLRQDIIWHKTNSLPEPVRDRFVRAHEYVFLLSKSRSYYWDWMAATEPVTHDGWPDVVHNGGRYTRNRRSVWSLSKAQYKDAHFATFPVSLVEHCMLPATSEAGCCAVCGTPLMRIVEHDSSNGSTELRSVGWQRTCEHEQAETKPCVVLDPFGGSGTVMEAAIRHGRASIIIDINPQYCELARNRAIDAIENKSLPLFVEPVDNQRSAVEVVP